MEKKIMSDYIIYCTEEQTRKALELGAPIEYHCPNEREKVYLHPTTEQMIGWLEEQEVLCNVFPIGDYRYDGFGMRIMEKAKRFNSSKSDAIYYPNRKEATLAAIDAALKYLKTKRK